MRLPVDAALILVDLQAAIDDPCWGPRNNPQAETLVAALLAAWRSAAMPVLHVRHDSLSPNSPYRPGGPGHAFKPEAAPLPGEAVIAKRTGSAFIDGALEAALDALGSTHLVLCGVLTNNSLEATARHAGDLGYRVFVVSDACWAVDKRDASGRLWGAEDVHRLSLANLEGEYARVVPGALAIEAARLAASRRKPGPSPAAA